jgi:2'-5' RNA ligase
VSAERARVFFALWPDTPVRDALAQAGAAAQAECGGKATPRDKIHLTLVFIGDLERSRIAALRECADRVEAEPFELRIDVLEYWRHNRIVWAGTTKCPEPLAALAVSLTRNLSAHVHVDQRPYVPHVTLVRNTRHPPRAAALEVPRWPAREFVLIDSVSAGGRSRYEVIARWPLGDGKLDSRA